MNLIDLSSKIFGAAWETKAKTIVTGIAAGALFVLGSALIQLNANEAIDWNEWLHTLVITELSVLGSNILNVLRTS